MNVILLIMLRRVYSLRTPKAIVKKMFDSGFWLGIVFVIEPFSLMYALLVYASIALFQKLTIRSFFIPIVGFSVPLICYFTYCFWMHQTQDFLQLFAWYTEYDFSFYQSQRVMIPLSVLGGITVISILFKTPKVLLISGNYRRFWTLMILNLLVSIAFVVLAKNKNGAELMAAFFPLAVILTNGVEGFSKQVLQDLVLGIFMIASVVMLII